MFDFILKKEKKDWNYFIITLLIFFSGFKSSASSDEFILKPLPSYLLILQQQGSLLILILFSISIFIFFIKNKFTVHRNSKSLFFYYIFSFIVIISGTKIDLLRLVYITIVLLYYLTITPRLVFYNEKKLCIVKSIFYGTNMIVIINAVLFFIYPSSLIWKGRFYGTVSHPNFIGIILAINVSLCFFYFLNNKKKIRKFFLLFLVVISLVMSFSTGSRTSLGLSLMSIFTLIFFRLRNIQTKILVSLIILLVLLFFSNFISLDTFDYVERGNTREDTWRILYKEATKFPLFGKGKVGVTSNSYLFAIVASGVVGALFLFASIIKSLSFIFFKGIKTNSNIIYFVLLLIILLGAVMEGYLLDNVAVPIFVYWFLLAYQLNYYNNIFYKT